MITPTWLRWPVAAALACLCSRPLPAADEKLPARPRLLTVVVLDTSGSMAGSRLTTAVAEIKQAARALPPAAQTPWAIIPFHHEAYDRRTFTEPDALVAYLDRLRADGGTKIAAGLREALESVRRADAEHVNVLLYTDGEDSDTHALETEQERLGKLFDERSERGLGQAVICRRWGGANAHLVGRLQQRKSVRVIDASEASFTSLVLEPELRCLEARRQGDAVEVRVRTSVHTSSQTVTGFDLGPLRFRCVTPGAEGDVAAKVAVGARNARELAVRLRAPEGTTSVRLDFEVEVPGVERATQGLVVATLARDRLSLTADLPRPTTVTAAPVSATAPRWVSLAEGTAAFDVTVRVRVDGPLDGNTTLVLLAPPGVRSLQLSPSTVRTGEQTVTLSLVAAVRPPPQPTVFVFAIQPPSPGGAVEIKAPEPLRVQVRGPAPAQLVLAHNGQGQTLEAELPDDGVPARFAVCPVLHGVPDPAAAARGLAAVVRVKGGLERVGDRPLALSQAQSLELKPRAAPEFSFLRDRVMEGWISVEPSPDCPFVLGASYRVVLNKEAPLKRVLLVAALVLFTVVLLLAPCWFFWRLCTRAPRRPCGTEPEGG